MDAENLCMHLIPCLSHLVNDSDLPVSFKSCFLQSNFLGESHTCYKDPLFGGEHRKEEVQRLDLAFDFDFTQRRNVGS